MHGPTRLPLYGIFPGPPNRWYRRGRVRQPRTARVRQTSYLSHKMPIRRLYASNKHRSSREVLLGRVCASNKHRGLARVLICHMRTSNEH